jgi:hypothetical protein
MRPPVGSAGGTAGLSVSGSRRGSGPFLLSPPGHKLIRKRPGKDRRATGWLRACHFLSRGTRGSRGRVRDEGVRDRRGLAGAALGEVERRFGGGGGVCPGGHRLGRGRARRAGERDEEQERKHAAHDGHRINLPFGDDGGASYQCRELVVSYFSVTGTFIPAVFSAPAAEFAPRSL